MKRRRREKKEKKNEKKKSKLEGKTHLGSSRKVKKGIGLLETVTLYLFFELCAKNQLFGYINFLFMLRNFLKPPWNWLKFVPFSDFFFSSS